MKTIIKNYHYRNNDYVIIAHCGYYCAINTNDIDDNGKLIRELNGLQMFASDTVKECIERVNNSIDFDYYLECGYSKGEAMCLVHHLPMDRASAINKIMTGE